MTGKQISIEAVISELRRRRTEQVRFLAELVRSPTDNPPGECAAHANRTADLLTRLGLTVERHPVPTELVTKSGMASATNLIVRRRFGAGPIIALNAHGDAVPPGEGWSHDPYGAEIVDGTIFGRGVVVSKSDFATYVFALLALDPLEAELAGTVELHFTYDEETGGTCGPKWLLDRKLTRPDCAIVAGFSYAVVSAHNGCLHLQAKISGRTAHAAQPDDGVDALEAAVRVLDALYDHRRELASLVPASSTSGIGTPKLNVGMISGGTNTNVVPGEVSLRLDRRVTPEEDIAVVEASLYQLITRANRNHPEIDTSISTILIAHPLVPTARSTRLGEIVSRHASMVLNMPISVCGLPLYTDARHYAEAGIPVVLYGAGPKTLKEAKAHGADEALRIEDLFAATEVMARTLLDLLNGTDDVLFPKFQRRVGSADAQRHQFAESVSTIRSNA